MQYRYAVVFFIFTSSMTVFVDRINLPVTILHMTKNISLKNGNFSKNKVCLRSSNLASTQHEYRNKIDTQLNNTFKWNRTKQGQILSSFYWSFIAMQIPAGLIIQKFGSKWVCFIAFSGIAVVNLAFPSAVDHVPVLMGLRIISGGLQAPIIASTFALVSKWTPQNERSTTIAFGQMGKILGSVIASLVSGYVCKFYNWCNVFYATGVFTLIIAISYLFVVENDPKESSCVSTTEYNYIINQIPQKSFKRNGFPWKFVLTSRIVWIMIFSRFAFATSVVLMLVKFPDYLISVIGLDIDQVGYFMALINGVNCLSNIASAFLADYCIKRKLLYSKTITRKVFAIINSIGSSISFCLISQAKCNLAFLFAFSSLQMIFQGVQSGGLLPIVTDLTNEHSPTLNGFAAMISMSSACILPFLIGVLLDAFPDAFKHVWWNVFYSIAVLQFVAGLTFAVWGSAEMQNWNFTITKNTKFEVLKKEKIDCVENNRVLL